MPRPHKCRCVASQPGVSMFKPCGVPARALGAVELRLDELEALRLADLQGLYQEAAAKRMGISRATFGRLVEDARRKVADAILNSKTLIIKGGVVVMTTKRIFQCVDCGSRFDAAHGTGRPRECPSCHRPNFHRAVEDRGCARGGEEGQVRGRQGRGRCRRAGRNWRGGAGAAAVRPTAETQEVNK